MKNQIVFLGIMVLFNTSIAFSQEEEVSKSFSYRSFSISPLGIYVGGNAGVAISGDVSFDYGKDIFSLGIVGGTEGNFIGSSDDFTEINFLYGRSFSVSEKVFIEPFIGAGYFHFNTYGYIDSEKRRKGDIDKNTIGFPLGAKFQFRLGPRYSMGIKLQANINSVESLGTLGLVLQWNRKRN